MDPQVTPTASPAPPADDRSDLLKSMDQDAGQAQQAATGTAAPVYGGPHVIQPDEKMSVGETIANVVNLDWIGNAVMRAHQEAGFQPDGTEMPKLDTPEFKELTQGIPENLWDRLYGADSVAQRQWIADELRNEVGSEQRLQDSGAFGVAGRFVTDALDPIGLAVGVATGGIGVAGKAARMAKAAAKLEKVGKIADAAATLERASAITKATSAGKIALQRGAIDSAVNMALAETTVQGTPYRDQWDVVHAGLLGFGMGAGLSRVFAGSELTAIRRSLEDTRAKVTMAELNDHIEARKADIINAAENSPTATDLQHAQDDLAAVQARAAQASTTAEHLEGIKAVQDAQKAVEDAQKAHDAAMAAHEADLAKLTQMQEAGVRGLKEADSAEAAQNASVFGPDSGGAARYMGAYESVNPDHEYPSGLPMSQQAMSKFGRAIGTITSILRGNDNDVVRAEAGPLVGDTIGTIDGSTSSFGASEIAKRLNKAYTTKFNQAVTDAYKGWVEARGMTMHGAKAWTRPVRDQFMSDVGLHIRGQLSQDKDVARAGESIRALIKSWDDDAKEAGVPGFEEGHDNPNFLPRVFDFNALERIEHQIGTPNVKLLFQKAIQKALPEIEEKIAARMAHHYVIRMKQLRVGDDIGMLSGMQFSDIGFLRKFLEESGAGKAEVDEIADKFAALKKSQHKDKGGDFRSAKHRTMYDENFGMDFKDAQASVKSGEDKTVHVKISDLLENNVESLMGRYQRSMAGHIGLAKVGIKSHAEFMTRQSRVRAALEHDPEQAKKVTQIMDLVYKLVTGQPVEDADTLTRFGRLIRDWNYATTMNQAGFSQTPDWAAMLSTGYFRYTMRMIPEMRATMKRLRNGDIADEEANMIQDWLGVGTDNYNNSVFSSYDDPLLHDGFRGVMGSVEHGLRVAGRVTTKISGLGWMNDVGTRMAAKAVLWRLTDEVRKGGVISSKRLAQIGLDQKMLARIKAQINGTTEHVDADFVGKQRILNFAKWTDIEARDAMLNGIFREARRMFQEEDLGETSAWMHRTLGKLILQFRRFMLVSYTKQMLYAANMRDAEAATQVLVGTALAGLSYTTQFGIKAASISDPDEREKFKEKYLTPKAISLAAWSRGNYSAFFPAALDSLTGTFLGIKNFDNRASQLGSGLFDGNPTVSTFNSMGQAVGSLVQPLVRGDKQFTRSDAAAWRHLMPFQNFIGMDIPFNAMTKNLPKRSTDPNPNEVDWALLLH